MLENIRRHLKKVNRALDIAIGPQDLKSLYSQVKCSPFVSGGHLMIFMSFEIIDTTPHSMDVWKISSFGVPIKASPTDQSLRARLLRTEYPKKQLMVALSLPYTHIAFSTTTSVVITYTEHQISRVRRIGSRIVLPPKAYQTLSSSSECLNCLVQMCTAKQIRKICMVDIIFQESVFIHPTGPNAWLVHAKDEKVFSMCGGVSSSLLTASDVVITVPCGCYLKIGSSLTTPIAVSSNCNSGKALTTEYIVPALLLGGANVTLDREIWSALAKAHPDMDLRTSDLAEKTSMLFVKVQADQTRKIQATRANQDKRWKSQLSKITESFQSSERAELEMMAFLRTIKIEKVLPALIAIMILTVVSVGILAIMFIRLYSRNQRLMASNLRTSAMGGAFIGSLSKCDTAEVSREVMVWVEALNGSYPVRITRVDEGLLPDGWSHVAYYIGSAVTAGVILAILSIAVRWIIAQCRCLPITLRNPNYCNLPTSWSQVVSIYKEAGREIDIEIWKKVKHAIVVQNLWLCPIVRDACCDIFVLLQVDPSLNHDEPIRILALIATIPERVLRTASLVLDDPTMIASVEVTAFGKRSMRYSPRKSMLLTWGSSDIPYTFEIVLTEGSCRTHPPTLLVEGAVSICRLHPDRAIPLTKVTKDQATQDALSTSTSHQPNPPETSDIRVTDVSQGSKSTEERVLLSDWENMSLSELAIQFKQVKGGQSSIVSRPKRQRSAFR